MSATIASPEEFEAQEHSRLLPTNQRLRLFTEALPSHPRHAQQQHPMKRLQSLELRLARAVTAIRPGSALQ